MKKNILLFVLFQIVALSYLLVKDSYAAVYTVLNNENNQAIIDERVENKNNNENTSSGNNLDNNYYQDTQYYFKRSIYSSFYSELPKVLSATDIKIYHQIYTVQNNGDFKYADYLITTLDNKILLGYMYYLRYISDSYKPSFQELKAWLENYNTLAVASFIYKMAEKKAPNSIERRKLRSPNSFYDRFVPIYLRTDLFKESVSSIQNIEEEKVRLVNNKLAKKINEYIKKGRTLNIKNTLLMSNTRALLGNNTYDYYAMLLSKLYFLDGVDDQAIYWGKIAVKRNPNLFVEAYFTLGLSYYRQGDYENARAYFKVLAKKEGKINTDFVVKGAYWAARTSLLLGDVDGYFEHLSFASTYIYNFYGVLALEELGIRPNYSFSANNYLQKSFDIIANNNYGRRAFALLQLGLLDWAEQELVFLANYDASKMNKEDEMNTLNVITYMAQSIPMPALSLKLAGQNGKYYGLSNLTYPVFLVDLQDGYKVDPALLLAVMKKESLFFSAAQSAPGATGLMQVLPSTATYLINKYNIPANDNSLTYDLTSPVYNIEIGQNYISLLLENKEAENNLIYVLAGYNAGFSLVSKWKTEKHRIAKDALFFIESIPYSETREYVKSVLTDYWIYQLKLDIPSHSLTSTVQGGQPIYYSISSEEIEKLKTR